MSTLELIDVTAGYSQLPIVRGVSMRAEAGKIVSVLGANGSGKSTLLKAIIGLLKPTSGRVTLVDKELTGLQPYQIVQAGVGYVPQSSNVFVSLNVVENLEMGAFVRKGNVRSSIDRILDSFPDLRAAHKKRAGDLSVGQRNLLGLARALMLDPKVILVDEPTAGLAPANMERIWQQLVSIAASGTAVVVVEQNVDMAVENSDWCYVLVSGQTRMDCAANAVRRDDLHNLFLGKVS